MHQDLTMLKRGCLLVVVAVLLSACSHHSPVRRASIKEFPPHVVQQSRMVSSFSEVTVSGRLNVSLHTGYKKPLLVLKGDPRDLAQVSVVVRNQGLLVSLGAGYPQYGEVSADIQGSSLDLFRFDGAGLVTGNQLSTKFLSLYLNNQGTTRLGGSLGIQDLVVKGDGLTQLSGVNSSHMKIHLIGKPKVQISGVVQLAELHIDGDASLSLYWLKSRHLIITGRKKAKIQLAGIVNRLEVELWGESQFKGRYLRARRSFVKTHNRSVAEVTSVHHQSSKASDTSDIYYYNIPDTRADFMAKDGSVLDMRNLSSPFMDEEYTRYNKQFP